MIGEDNCRAVSAFVALFTRGDAEKRGERGVLVCIISAFPAVPRLWESFFFHVHSSFIPHLGQKFASGPPPVAAGALHGASSSHSFGAPFGSSSLLLEKC